MSGLAQISDLDRLTFLCEAATFSCGSGYFFFEAPTFCLRLFTFFEAPTFFEARATFFEAPTFF